VRRSETQWRASPSNNSFDWDLLAQHGEHYRAKCNLDRHDRNTTPHMKLPASVSGFKVLVHFLDGRFTLTCLRLQLCIGHWQSLFLRSAVVGPKKDGFRTEGDAYRSNAVGCAPKRTELHQHTGPAVGPVRCVPDLKGRWRPTDLALCTWDWTLTSTVSRL
jgi:hypothetical protein